MLRLVLTLKTDEGMHSAGHTSLPPSAVGDFYSSHGSIFAPSHEVLIKVHGTYDTQRPRFPRQWPPFSPSLPSHSHCLAHVHFAKLASRYVMPPLPESQTTCAVNTVNAAVLAQL